MNIVNPYRYGAAVAEFDANDYPNLTLWLKGGAGIVYSSAPEIQEWEDQSGNGNDGLQSNAAARPSDELTINGQPSVYFDGGDNVSNYPTTIFPAASSYTFFFVIEVTLNGPGGTNNSILFSWGDQAASRSMSLRMGNSGQLILDVAGNTSCQSTTNIITVNTPYLFSGKKDVSGAVTKIWLNDVAVGNSNVVTAFPDARFYRLPGTVQNIAPDVTGKYGDSVVYEDNFSDATISEINQKLMAKYSI